MQLDSNSRHADLKAGKQMSELFISVLFSVTGEM